MDAVLPSLSVSRGLAPRVSSVSMMSALLRRAANIRAVWPFFSALASGLAPWSSNAPSIRGSSTTAATSSARLIWPSRVSWSLLVARSTSTHAVVAGVGSLEQRGQVFLVARPHVGVAFDQGAHGVGLVGGGGEDERGVTVLVGEIGVGVLVEQGLGHVHLPGGGGGHQRGDAVRIDAVAVHAATQVGFDHAPVADVLQPSGIVHQRAHEGGVGGVVRTQLAQDESLALEDFFHGGYREGARKSCGLWAPSHQTTQALPSFMGVPAAHWYVAAKAGVSIIGPFTRKRGGECGSERACVASSSGRSLAHQPCA